jgi:hypothetical protein
VSTFKPTSIEIDMSMKAVRFGFQYADGSAGSASFHESVYFDLPEALHQNLERLERFVRVLPVLHCLLGVSYFMSSVPRVVDLRGCQLTREDYALVCATYTDGLAEFAYRNDIPRVFETEFLIENLILNERDSDYLGSKGTLVPFGGGKDSIVSVELLREAGRSPVPFIVNPLPAIRRSLAASGLQAVTIRRFLDVKLLDPEIARFQGHVPVSVLNSYLAVATAALGGFNEIALSNEASASEPNLYWQGRAVNHQWAKSQDAERLISSSVRSRFGESMHYFSLLRGFSETEIAFMFAQLAEYDDVFVSCNTGILAAGLESRWCLSCDKCRFVFLVLAAAMGKERVVRIFGVDMFSDRANERGFRMLAGLEGFKPFDCVGEIGETQSLLRLLAQSSSWSGSPFLSELIRDLDQLGAQAHAQMTMDKTCLDDVPADGTAPGFVDPLT